MAQQRHTVGDAMRSGLTKVAFGFSAQILILLFGTTTAFALRKGNLQTSDLFIVLLGSGIPYAILAVNLLLESNPFQPPAETKGAHTIPHHALPPEQKGRGKDYHLVPVTNTVDTLDGVPLPYLEEFINQIPVRGWTFRAWVNKYEFKDGTLCDLKTWDGCCKVLEKGGLLIDRGPRKKGRMKNTDPFTIKVHLRLYNLL